ncbi:hypothetical protein GCM10029964_034490 [Kibdelosporangium lantanae]
MTLGMARRVAGDLAGGLTGPRVRAAARGIRRLLGVSGIGLADLSGTVEWAGHSPSGVDTTSLVETVLHTEVRAGRLPVVALPLHVRDELEGVLVVAGARRMSPVREVADWVSSALERTRLDALADQAAQLELRALRAEISPLRVQRVDRHRVAGAVGPGPVAGADAGLRGLHAVQLGPPW